jgi:hypothetical protein
VPFVRRRRHATIIEPFPAGMAEWADADADADAGFRVVG